MKTNENVIYRCVADEHILIPVGESAQSNNGLFVLNEVSAEVWKLLVEGKSEAEIVAHIAENYDAELAVIEADVKAVIEKFAEAGLVTE